MVIIWVVMAALNAYFLFNNISEGDAGMAVINTIGLLCSAYLAVSEIDRERNG